jgi:hypothetical protein
VIRVIEGEWIYPILAPPEICLLVRRDVRADGSYKEFSYVGPAEEVHALSKRFIDAELDQHKVDDLLRQGFSIEDALQKLGA